VISTWPAPANTGGSSEELLVGFSKDRMMRVLILPAWFDEANKLRRFTLGVMRRLDEAGIDSFLPDLPGCNESLAPLEAQTLEHWREVAEAAARHVGATHVLALRSALLIAPAALPGWIYAGLQGSALLQRMVRARLLAAREAGRTEARETLMEQGQREGLILGGWPIGAELFSAMAASGDARAQPGHAVIEQSEIGGAGLWLRSEPAHDPAQAAALAARIIADLRAAQSFPG
jgi:hypothetical protein